MVPSTFMLMTYELGSGRYGNRVLGRVKIIASYLTVDDTKVTEK